MGRRALEAGRTSLRFWVILFVLVRAWLRVRLLRRSAEHEIYRSVVRLGPTAIKLAQVASTRPDLVPAAVSQRLESLQEAAPQFPFDDAREVIEQELGAPIEALFRSLPEQPSASASLSQVYFATLVDGSAVAVKVQRPGIELRIQRDVGILASMARLATLLRPSLRNLRLADAMAQFGHWTLRELNFRLEGENADELRQNFSAWADVHIPTIHWSHTRRRVLTMERVSGRRVKDLMHDLDDDARLELVRRLADMVMKMFVDDGLFHADLHPGNIFFPNDGRIVLLDVGMVGRMNRGQADRFLAYWMAVGRRQRDRAFHHLLGLAAQTKQADLAGYRAAYDEILDAFDGSTVTERSLARTYLDVVQRGAVHGVVFPSEMLLQAKALVTMEALCLFMAPGFRFSEEMRPIVARRLANRFTPNALVDRAWTMLPDLVVAGEWFHTERDPGDLHAEPSFRNDAIVAIAQTWIDAADAYLEAHRDARFPDPKHRPHLASLIDLVVGMAGFAPPDCSGVRSGGSPGQENTAIEPSPEARWVSFHQASRTGTAGVSGGRASWRSGRPWLGGSASALFPVARIALVRAEAAIREQATHGLGEVEAGRVADASRR